MSTEIESQALVAIRRLLLAILFLGMLGSLVDLLLIEHLEDRLQFVPVILLGLGLALLAWSLLKPNRLAIRLLQITMLAFMVAGLVGVYYHFRGNEEFALERELEGSELFWDSVMGVPPVLAPGAMVYLGLLGIAYAYRHPRLRGG